MHAQPVTSQPQVARRRQHHVGTLELAATFELADVARLAGHLTRGPYDRMSSDPVPSDALPTLSEFQHACRLTKRAAPGCDGFTRALWKGGFYRDLLKSITTDPSACISSRSILVSSQLGEASRRCLRTRLIPALLATAGDAQFGGVPGRGTGHASVIIRFAQAVAAARAL
eukprot:7137116-Pyramimonas_sp.AAC.1